MDMEEIRKLLQQKVSLADPVEDWIYIVGKLVDEIEKLQIENVNMKTALLVIAEESKSIECKTAAIFALNYGSRQ